MAKHSKHRNYTSGRRIPSKFPCNQHKQIRATRRKKHKFKTCVELLLDGEQVLRARHCLGIGRLAAGVELGVRKDGAVVVVNKSEYDYEGFIWGLHV